MAGSLIRGTPIYVARGDERIALVPEIRAIRKRFRAGPPSITLTALDPSAVYLIDRQGVRRLPLGLPLRRWLKLVPLSFLVGPVLYVLARWSKKNG